MPDDVAISEYNVPQDQIGSLPFGLTDAAGNRLDPTGGLLVAAGVTALAAAITGAVNSQLFFNAGAPTSGGTGTLAGVAIKGALLSDTTNGVLYSNTGTLASPTWSELSEVFSINAIGQVTTAATLKLGWNSLKLTHAQACTIAALPPARFIGEEIVAMITQDTVSLYNGTIVWPASVKTAGGSIPAVTATNGAYDQFILRWDGTVWVLTPKQAIA
jgi:hypothetical protein